jgi:two-component system chemotaxis response regulator CheB
MLVDDSVAIRGALGNIIDAEPDMRVVTTAVNGRMALDALKHTPIDIVILDVEMPEMDGLTALPQILAQYPATRVLMASSLTKRGAQVTLQALALGAADFVHKPSATQGARALAAIAADLVGKVRAIGRAGRGGAGAGAQRSPVAARPATVASEPARLVAVAASTGGPNALAAVLGGLPRDFPLPILVTQHMPPLFTTMLAQRLSRDSNRPCAEAVDRQPILPGHTYVAPGDYHLTVATVEGQPLIRLSQSPPENYCRPAADPMFRTAAAIYGASLLAVVLTGMGEDGRRGCEEVVRRGGRVVAQDEATSVVWGMPGAVVNAGLAAATLPVGDIAGHLMGMCCVAP